jgi:hypothetical protein
LVFPARPLRGCRSPGPPSRLIPPVRSPSCDVERGPPGLRSPPELVTSRPGRPKSTILLWDSLAPSGRVTGAARQPPLHRLRGERPLPRDVPAALRSPRFHLDDHVPSSWFRTTSTAFSAHRLRACCIPLPIWGSPRFTHRDPIPSANRRLRDHTHAPRDAGSHPPEDVLLPIRRTASPRSSRIVRPVAARRCCQHQTPDPPWARSPSRFF